ncbi:MAG TPA: DUF2059 domain-containing protein [Gemmatimonadaceae bacterium]
MLSRILVLLAVGLLCGRSVRAEAQPANEASIKKLLEVSHAHELMDNVMGQMETTLDTVHQQVTSGHAASPEVERIYNNARHEVTAAVRDSLTWDKVEPMYIRVYQKSFTQQEVEGMITFYQTPTGQAVIKKLPLVMQDSMNETMQLMAPVIQRIQRMQQDMVTAIEHNNGAKSKDS